MNNMNNDDLYLTNRYQPISHSSNRDNSIEYKRLLDAKARSSNTYKNNNPRFTEQVNIDRRSGIDLMDDSPGFDQYIHLASINKNKKVKKTIVNIDSRNRQTVSLFSKKNIVLRKSSTFQNPNDNLPFYFKGNSNDVVLLLETQLIDSIDNKQIIIADAPPNLFKEINLDDNLFVFNTFNVGPIFGNLEFYYDPLIDETSTNRQSNVDNMILVTDKSKIDDMYKYNAILFKLNKNIDPTIIYHNTIGNSSLVTVQFIENVNIAYPNTSHYIVNLGRTFSNIYSIRMLSAEIPNTGYTFTGNRIVSDIGKMRLSTQVNNRLRWIVKDNNIKQFNYHLLESSLFNKFSQTGVVTNSYDINTYNEMKPLYTITDTNNPLIEPITDSNNYERRNSLYRETNAYNLDNNGILVTKDQFTLNYIGELTTNTIDPPNYNINSSKFVPQELIHPYCNDKYESHLLFAGKFINFYDISSVGISYDNGVSYYGNDSSNNLAPNISTIFILDNQFNAMVVSMNVNDLSNNEYQNDWVQSQILSRFENAARDTNRYPIRMQLHSRTNTDMNRYTTYIFDVVNISTKFIYPYKDVPLFNYRVQYIFYYIPIYGDYQANDNFYFNNFEDIILTVWNPLNETIISNIQHTQPYTWDLIKRYYLQTVTHSFTTYSIDISANPIYPSYDISGSANILYDFKQYYNSYYKFTSNTTSPSIGTFSKVGNTLYLNSIDYYNNTNTDIIKNSNTFDYLLALPFYFKDISGAININQNIIEITFDISNTNYGTIFTLPDISSAFVDNKLYELKFEKYDLYNIEYLYIFDELSNPLRYITSVPFAFTNDIYSGILRLSEKYSNYNALYKYLDLFLGKINYIDASTNEIIPYDDIFDVSMNKYYYVLDVRYKDSDNFSNNTRYLTLLEESHKTYIRNTIHNYSFIKTLNSCILDITSSNPIYTNCYNGYDISYNGYDLSVNTIPYLFDMIKSMNNSNNEFANMSDTNRYKTMGIFEIQYDEGISQTSRGLEYIVSNGSKNVSIFPAVDETINQILIPYNFNSENLKEYERYPLYEYQIEPAKYNERTLTKYINTLLEEIDKQTYDYQKEVFSPELNYNQKVNLHFETNVQTKYRLIMDINSINRSLALKYYRLIFATNYQSYNKKRNYIYYNDSFPYLYFNIPDITVTNGSILYIEGADNLDNIPAEDVNTEVRAIIPKNYRVQVRQLLPLPNIDYLNNQENMFSNEGYVKDDLNEIYNTYVNYINASLNDNARIDNKFEFIMDRLFNVGETNYSRDTNELNLYKQQGYVKNEYQFNKAGLNSIYNDSYGNNRSYNKTRGYNDLIYNKQTRNKAGLEYMGSALVNNGNNDKLWSEYKSNLNITNGFRTTFIENECFVRLSDLYQNIHHTLIGRIVYSSKFTDEFGNVTIDYDLFCDDNLQFNLFDIVIGLDSQTIGILLPYDYKYGQLPNLEVKLLGLGAYILHTQYDNINSFYDRFKSIDNLLQNNKFLANYLTKVYNSWIIDENMTNKGFYIRLNITPNTSRLEGIKTDNLSIYSPDFFKLLGGDDTPLDIFGFKNVKYNNEFNYFKDNLSPFEIGLINKSYNVIINNTRLVLIFQMKEQCNVNVNDRVYIEDHDVISDNINSYIDVFYNVDLLQPFSKYITQLETIYNTEILNYNGYSRVVPYRYNNNNDGSPYFIDNTFTLETNSVVTQAIPFKNTYITYNYSEDINCFSTNYFLYYQKSLAGISAETFSIDNRIDDTSIYVYDNNNLIDILDKFRNLPTGVQVRIMEKIDIVNQREVLYYYKNYNSRKFLKNSNSNLLLTRFRQYYVQIHIYRRPIIFKNRNSSNIITEYETMGIFERLMTEWMENMLTIYRRDINKANYFNSKYNPSIFKNRILKLRVSPIDNLGFSYEPYSNITDISSINSIASYTNSVNRFVKGYSRKLFPYHEYSIYQTYDSLDTGENILPNSYVYRNYLRPKQTYGNNEVDSKVFLKGMGVYIINEDICNNKVGNLPATSYNYNNKFIGYVLDTSIDYDNNSYFRDYMLNAETFSNIDLSSSRTSDYYIYLLIDENIQSVGDMTELFNILNNDYNHIIFDGTAKENEIISIPGLVNGTLSQYAYDISLNSNTNTINLGTLLNNTIDTSSYAYIIRQNIYGNTSYLDISNVPIYQEDKYISNTNIIDDSHVDGMLGLYTGHIAINRRQANKTLPYYSYATRIACGTIVERPVVCANDASNTKLFISGMYDYFYKDYMQNKTIMNYRPIESNETIEYLNKHQFIDENANSANFKSKNYKEIDCHNGYIDSFYQKSLEYARGLTYDNADRKTLDSTIPQRNFDIGDDIVFINSNKRKVVYNLGPNYNTIKDIDTSYGIESYNVKVLLGSLLPKIYVDDSRYLSSIWNSMFVNKCILDLDYYKNNLESFHLSQCLAKSRGYDLDVVGYRSNTYYQNTAVDKYQYNFVFANNYYDISGFYGSYLNINPYNVFYTDNLGEANVYLELNDPSIYPKLINCMIVTYPLLQTTFGVDPINSIDFSEVGYITDISNISETNMTLILENRLQNTLYINSKITPYENPSISIPYKVYTGVATSRINEYGNTCVSSKLILPNSNILTFIIPNDKYLEQNLVFTGTPIAGIDYPSFFHNEMIYNEKLDIIIDYTNSRYIDYDIAKSIPFEIDDISGTLHNSTCFSRINTGFSNKKYTPYIYDYAINNVVTNSSFNSGSINDKYYIYLSTLTDNTSIGNGIYKKINNSFTKYNEMDGLQNTYLDLSNVNTLYSAYSYLNNSQNIQINNVNNVEIIRVSQSYRYGNLIQPTGPSIFYDYVQHLSYALVPTEANQYLYVQGDGVYYSDVDPFTFGFAWYPYGSFDFNNNLINIRDSSGSFYYKNLYGFDINDTGSVIDKRSLPIYESEIYRNPLYYDYFVYDKIDIQVNDISLINDTFFNNFPYGMKVLDVTTNKLYINLSSLNGNNLVEYSVPNNAIIKIYQDLSSSYNFTTINNLKLYLKEENFFYDIQPDSSKYLDDYYSGPAIFDPLNSAFIINTDYKYVLDYSGTFLFDDINIFDVSGIFPHYSLPESGVLQIRDGTYKISNVGSFKNDIIYNAGSFLPLSPTEIFQLFTEVYPLNTQFTVYDILTYEQRNDILLQNSTNPFLQNNTLIIDYSGQYYQYKSSTNTFNILSNYMVQVNENIHIYNGNYSGHHNKLFKIVNGIMVFAQYYSDMNIADFYFSYFNESVPFGTNDMNFKNYKPFDKILVQFGNGSTGSLDRQNRIYMFDASMNLSLINNTVFNINNITVFVENPVSFYRGQTFYRQNDLLLNRILVSYTDSKLPIYYPEDVRIIGLANPLRDKPTSTLAEYNCVASQPFLSNNEWYTKIYYRGSTQFIGRNRNIDGSVKGVFNDININNYVGGNAKYNKYNSNKLFISGMKGLRIPYININKPPETTLVNNTPYYYENDLIFNNIRYMSPVEPSYYVSNDPLVEDYQPLLTTDVNNRSVYGQFLQNDNNFESGIGNNITNYYDTKYKFYNSNQGFEYPYIIIKGIYLGYGGHIQERQNADIVNTIVNNNIGFRVDKVSVVGTTQYLYIELPISYSQYFNSNKFNTFDKSGTKSRNRLSTLPLDIEYKILDDTLADIDNYSLSNVLNIYGDKGRIVRKNITTPYDLNQNNYVFLVIPDLNHIDPVENNDLNVAQGSAFAKILFPGNSSILYNTFVSSQKVYYDYLFNNLNQLEIAFVTNNGALFDFNGAEHSFSLEITEIIDKLEYINPRFGNIEF
jgi:hypothetical protein